MNIFSDVFSNIVSEMGLWIKLYHYLCLSRYSINKGMKAKTREWLLAFLAGFLATVLGIVFTFGTSALLERRQRAADRRTSALMVMGSIESFARQLEESADNLARLDTVISWMLSVPVEQLDQVPPEMLSSTLLSLNLPVLSHDTSAENIFSSSVDTWRNLGSFQFIDNVGTCFRNINQMESTWNEWAEGNSQFFFQAYRSVSASSSNPVAAVLRDPQMRSRFLQIHNSRSWMRYFASDCRHRNRINMELIGIKEQELERFLETRPIHLDEPAPGMRDFNAPLIPRDSIVTMSSFDAAIR